MNAEKRMQKRILIVDEAVAGLKIQQFLSNVFRYFDDVFKDVDTDISLTSNCCLALDLLCRDEKSDKPPFDLILVNYLMSDLNGIEFANAVRECFRNDVKIILMAPTLKSIPRGKVDLLKDLVDDFHATEYIFHPQRLASRVVGQLKLVG